MRARDIEIAAAVLDRLQGRVAVDRALLPWTTQRELNRFLLEDSAVDLEDLLRDGFVTYEVEPPGAGQPFRTPSGKVELHASVLEALGHDPLPGYVEPGADTAPPGTAERYPLVLLTGEREKNYHHSRFRDQAWVRSRSPHPVLKVHPRTRAALDIADGAWVSIETAGGPAPARAVLTETDQVAPGVVVTGMGWWLPEAAEPWFGAQEVNINCALRYDGPTDPVVGSVDSRGLRCRIRAVA